MMAPEARNRVQVTFAGAFLFPEYAGKLRKASRGLPIQFLGELPHDLVLGLMAAADIFVCTSRRVRSRCRAQAMALGKAIVSTPVGFVPEILQDGVDVVVVPSTMLEPWPEHSKNWWRERAAATTWARRRAAPTKPNIGRTATPETSCSSCMMSWLGCESQLSWRLRRGPSTLRRQPADHRNR